MKVKTIIGVLLITLLIDAKSLLTDNLGYYKKNVSPQNEAIYIVKKGDNLISISENFKPKDIKLKNYLNKLQHRNNLQEVIYPGQKIVIYKK